MSASKRVTISLRLDADEHAVWSRQAAAEGRTLSSWIRWRCNQPIAPTAAPVLVERKPRKPRS